MNYLQKQELISVIEEHGVHKLFKELNFQEVKKQGENVYCVCPFHKGADNPTGFVYSNGFGYCFTNCHKKIDLFDIVMQANGCGFNEAVSYLSGYVGLDLSFSKSNRVTQDGDINRAFLNQVRKIKSKSNVSVAPFSKDILDSFEPVMHSMLRREGFDDDVREYFQLGFAQTGYMQNRITIPIDYTDASIITVSGRSVLSPEDLKALNTQRYLIWFDTDKSLTLYNISRAMPYIDITKEVVVVEGFKSVWRLHQWGIRNAVALMGSTMSSEQCKMLLRLNSRILVCGDRDKAGESLNMQVLNECGKFSDVGILDLFMLDIPEKSSIDDIAEAQFNYLYKKI